MSKEIPNLFDQSTYIGRVRHFSTLTNPLTLFASKSSLERAKSLVNDYAKTGKLRTPLLELQQAKQLYDSTYHPQTNEKIFMPFRMSAFVPANIFIILGMLAPNPSIPKILFWQWTNQSLNVAVNFANANKSIKMSYTEIGLSYFTACATSCTIAVGLNQLLIRKGSSLSAGVRSILGKIVPFTAVATAGVANLFLMRQKELWEGIQVQDDKGNQLGKSKIAGWTAVSQVGVSRVAVSACAVAIPGLIMNSIEKMNWYKSNPRLSVPVNLGVIASSLLVALPFAIGIYPSTARLPTSSLEDEFANLKDANGKAIDFVYFNRGL